MMRVGIIGPTGYAGFHALDILLRHPEAEIVYLGSRREERPHIVEVWPSLRKRIDMKCALLGQDDIPAMDAAIVALPHTIAMDHVPELLGKGVRVVDVSADYRLHDAAAYRKWYGKEHADPANLERAAYGLCELFRDDIAVADLVAKPG